MSTWSPPQSPLFIEYSDELLSELQPDPARIETTGFLYGRLEGNMVRLLSVKSGALPVGIYVLRERGEVFLSEADVDLFETNGVLLALVIAGQKGGFFVRGFDGSLQSIRSYEEFPVVQPTKRQNDAIYAAGLVCLAALPLTALAYLHQPQRAELSVKEDGGRLMISWKPGRSGVLTISDGEGQNTIPVSPNQSTTSYVRRGTGDVEVVLKRD